MLFDKPSVAREGADARGVALGPDGPPDARVRSARGSRVRSAGALRWYPGRVFGQFDRQSRPIPRGTPDFAPGERITVRTKGEPSFALARVRSAPGSGSLAARRAGFARARARLASLGAGDSVAHAGGLVVRSKPQEVGRGLRLRSPTPRPSGHPARVRSARATRFVRTPIGQGTTSSWPPGLPGTSVPGLTPKSSATRPIRRPTPLRVGSEVCGAIRDFRACMPLSNCLR